MSAVLLMHQDRILIELSRGERMLVEAAAPETALLVETRGRLSAALAPYYDYKHRMIFPPLIAGPDPVAARAARALRSNCSTMAETYKAHVEQWGAEMIRTQWSTYRVRALDIIGRLRWQLERERRDLLPLLVRAPPPARQATDADGNGYGTSRVAHR